VRWNPAEIEAAGKSPVCPVVALEATAEALGDLVEEGEVLAGSQLFLWK
jgi:PTS system N-acetylglucosamine-specific IIA component